MKGHPHSSSSDLLQALQQTELLQSLHRRRLAEGELLGSPHSERDSVFIISSGRIRVFLAFEDKEYTLTYLEEGDIYSTHSGAYLQAMRPTEVLTGTTQDMLGRVCTLPTAVPIIIRVLGRTLANSMQLIEDLAFRDVEGRLARFLHGMLVRKGIVQGDDILLALDLNTEDIARLLGTTRQTLSSHINKLAREGVLSRAGNGSFLIHQPLALLDLSQRGRA